MADSGNRSHPDQQIDALLQAERQAREAVAACQRQAESRGEEARIRAREIQERTDQRITRLHTECSRATDERVEWLLRKDAHTQERLTLEDEAVTRALDQAVERVVALLTGGEDEEPSTKES